MEKVIRVVTSILLAFLLIVTLTPNFASAQTPTSGKIDYVLIKMEDGKIVRITIKEYVDLFIAQTEPLYGFLKGTQDNLNIYGVVSGEKYISISKYVSEFINQDTQAQALEAAEELSITEVNSFLKVKSGSIEAGNIQLEPIKSVVVDTFVVIDIY